MRMKTSLGFGLVALRDSRWAWRFVVSLPGVPCRPAAYEKPWEPYLCYLVPSQIEFGVLQRTLGGDYPEVVDGSAARFFRRDIFVSVPCQEFGKRESRVGNGETRYRFVPRLVWR